MLKYYSWDTSNGRKAAILLEELGIKYQYHPVNIKKGEQFSDEFRELNPNSKIPLLVDDENNVILSESGAILMYLAERYDSNFFPQETQKKYEVIKWLMFQMSAIGPTFGQALHFFKYAEEEIPYGVERFVAEVHRLLNVMDKHLESNKYFANNSYSIADISIVTWIKRLEWLNIKLEQYPSIERWYKNLQKRAAVESILNGKLAELV